jgi:SAM-dependent methyltransferase
MPPRDPSLPDTAAVAAGTDARRSAPSAERNAAPILAELSRHAPAKGRLLELASGTGQHAAQFAAALPGLTWQPTDANPAMLASIAAWVAEARLPNLRAPLALDAASGGWGKSHQGQDLILSVNLLHLISEAEARVVIAGIADALAPGGKALIYGPFRRDGQLTSDGDRAFDARLRAQDPAIGYKDASAVAAWAGALGLHTDPPTAMPANNLLLVLGRPG